MAQTSVDIPKKKEIEMKSVLEAELPEFKVIVPEGPRDEDTIIEREFSGLRARLHRAKNNRNGKEVRCIYDVKRTLIFRQYEVF